MSSVSPIDIARNESITGIRRFLGHIKERLHEMASSLRHDRRDPLIVMDDHLTNVTPDILVLGSFMRRILPSPPVAPDNASLAEQMAFTWIARAFELAPEPWGGEPVRDAMHALRGIMIRDIRYDLAELRNAVFFIASLDDERNFQYRNGIWSFELPARLKRGVSPSRVASELTSVTGPQQTNPSPESYPLRKEAAGKMREQSEESPASALIPAANDEKTAESATVIKPEPTSAPSKAEKRTPTRTRGPKAPPGYFRLADLDREYPDIARSTVINWISTWNEPDEKTKIGKRLWAIHRKTFEAFLTKHGVPFQSRC